MRFRRVKTPAELQDICDLWNFRYPVGTQVEYHPVIGETEHRVRFTKSRARVLGDHTAIVFLEGESGCVALDACVPLNKAATP